MIVIYETLDVDLPNIITIKDAIVYYEDIVMLNNDTIRQAVINIDKWEAAIGPIEEWNTEQVTDMSYLFKNNKTFNRHISKWNTSNVTYMKCMFCGAESFNQPLDWNTSMVIDMCYMFEGAETFLRSSINHLTGTHPTLLTWDICLIMRNHLINHYCLIHLSLQIWIECLVVLNYFCVAASTTKIQYIQSNKHERNV